MTDVPTAGSSLREMFFGRLRLPGRAKQADQGKRRR